MSEPDLKDSAPAPAPAATIISGIQPRERLILIGLCFVSWIFMQRIVPAKGIMDGILMDSDGYHRLYRVQQLLDTGNWYDDRLPRYDAPTGLRSYWTRPLDVMLIIGQAVLKPFFTPEAALMWAGIWISPILYLVMVAAFWWATSGWMSERAQWLGLLAFLWEDCLHEQVCLGRADHHGLIILSNILVMGAGLRMWGGVPETLAPGSRRGGARGRAAGYWLGVAGALGVWVSTECQVFLYLVMAGLAAGWWFGEVEADQGPRQSGIWLIGVLAIALILERPPGNWLEAQYDRFSIVHVWAGALLMMFWQVLAWAGRVWKPQSLGRVMILAGATLAGCAAMIGLFPLFLKGPLSGLGPQMTAFLDLFMDETPLLPLTARGVQLLLLLTGQAIIAMPLVPWFIWSQRQSLNLGRWLFLFIPLPLLVFGVMMRPRLATMPEVFLALLLGPPLELLMERSKSWARPLARAAGRVLPIFAATIGPIVLAAFIKVDLTMNQEYSDSVVKMKMVCEDLNDPAIVASPTVIMAWVNYGPEIAYRTRHGVVGTTSHRNQEGLADSVIVYTGTDDAATRDVLRKRGADFLLHRLWDHGVCLPTGPLASDSLAERLSRGEVPAWLHPVPLVRAASTAFRLYSVEPWRPAGP